MKKTKKILLTIFISVCVILFAKSLWDEILSSFIPWTRTNFSNYQEYMELLEEHHCFGRSSFINKVSSNMADGKYYWHRNFQEMYAAHSMLLSEEEYLGIVEKRNEFYSETWKGWDNVVVYQSQG